MVFLKGAKEGEQSDLVQNKAKAIRTDILDLDFNLDLDFDEIFWFGDISVLVTFQFY